MRSPGRARPKQEPPMSAIGDRNVSGRSMYYPNRKDLKMYNTSNLYKGQEIEARVMRLLANDTVLSYDTLKRQLAHAADVPTVERVLADLIDRGLIARRAQRQGFWYVGYARPRAAMQELKLEDLPPAVAAFLNQLQW
jgi:predicted transcriptional regulator